MNLKLVRHKIISAQKVEVHLFYQQFAHQMSANMGIFDVITLLDE